MTTVVVSIDGVMSQRPPQHSILDFEATPSGRVLFSMIKNSARVLYLSNDPNEERVRSWLVRERLAPFNNLYCYPEESPVSPDEWQVEQVRALLSAGHHLSFYIGGNPQIVRSVLAQGVDAVLVATTAVVPGDSPYVQGQYTPWYDLVETIDERELLRSEKAVRDDDGATT